MAQRLHFRAAISGVTLDAVCFVMLFGTTFATASENQWKSGLDLIPVFAREVNKRIAMSDEERLSYTRSLDRALSDAGNAALSAQFVVLVDRDPYSQVAVLLWRSESSISYFIGASPVSTGKPGTFEHFATPVGVFEHSLANPDFRAEGTPNEFGVRGYGAKGMRVYDFGWVRTTRGWGTPVETLMRLQMHATDPRLLEPRLGAPTSKGCIRIPATLNHFLDHYGALDADYDRAMREGKRRFWVLPPDRNPTPWSGRYLVVIDSMRTTPPSWRQHPASALLPRLPAAGAG
ncbi:MAG: L,D-transpeptidase [Rhodocyclaceae bacterium]|nr:L,D-transpeptidase [Rhodocyclaceae bacterium]